MFICVQKYVSASDCLPLLLPLFVLSLLASLIFCDMTPVAPLLDGKLICQLFGCKILLDMQFAKGYGVINVN